MFSHKREDYQWHVLINVEKQRLQCSTTPKLTSVPCHLGLCHIITHGKLFHRDKLVSVLIDEFNDQFIILFMNKKTLIKHYVELRFNATWKNTYVTHWWHVVLHQDMCNTMFYFGSSNIFIACLHYYSLHFVNIMKWSIFPFLCSLIKIWVFQSHKWFHL